MARLSEKLRPSTRLFSQTLIFGLLTVAAPNVAHAAQDDADGWNFIVAPYLLFPHMSGDVAVRSIPAEVDVGPSDIFDNLDFGAMLFLEMTNPNWAIKLDGLYMDLGAQGALPLSGRAADVGAKQWALEVTGMRRLAPWAEVGIGARINSIKTALFVEAGMVLPEIDTSDKHTWVDPLIAARFTIPLENRWSLGVTGDLGGFGIGSSFAWQVRPFAGYRFVNWFELRLAYRVLGMDYETGSGIETFVYDVTTFGPEIGLLFHF